MKLLFAYPPGKGKPVSDSSGNQEVIAGLLSDSDMIVFLVDHSTKLTYIERVKNRFVIDLYNSTNFEVIDNDEEWESYMDYFERTGLIKDLL